MKETQDWIITKIKHNHQLNYFWESWPGTESATLIQTHIDSFDVYFEECYLIYNVKYTNSYSVHDQNVNLNSKKSYSVTQKTKTPIWAFLSIDYKPKEQPSPHDFKFYLVNDCYDCYFYEEYLPVNSKVPIKTFQNLKLEIYIDINGEPNLFERLNKAISNLGSFCERPIEKF